MDGQQVGLWTWLEPQAEDSDGWMTFTADLDSMIVSRKVAIAIGIDDGQAGAPWEIDDLRITGVVPRHLPEPVRDLTIDETGTREVRLLWDDTMGGSYYRVERRTADTDWVSLGYGMFSFNNTQWGYFDSLLPATEYFYRVIAMSPAGEAEPGDPVRFATVSAIQEWRMRNYGTAHDSPAAKPLADNGTGIPNLLRFAFNMTVSRQIWQDEESRNFSGLPAINRSSGTGLLRIEFFRRPEAMNPGIDYIVEFSDDCITWTPGGRAVEIIPSAVEMEKVIWEDDAPAPGRESFTRFARVRVTER
jgi:hypothetical protein